MACIYGGTSKGGCLLTGAAFVFAASLPIIGLFAAVAMSPAVYECWMS